MKSRKQLTLRTSVLVAFSIIWMVGIAPRPGQGQSSGLDLTDEQLASFQAVRQTQWEQISAVRNDRTLSPEEKRARIEAIRQGSGQQLYGILTPEQQQVLTDRQGRRIQNGAGGRLGGRSGCSGRGTRGLSAGGARGARR
jgi:Spy/CpxP family protein refolding chaperone